MTITDEMVEKAEAAASDLWTYAKEEPSGTDAMRAALEAVAPMLIAQYAATIAANPPTDELHYLRSILRCLREVKSFANSRNMEPTLRNEALADNIDWLDCYIDKRAQELDPVIRNVLEEVSDCAQELKQT